MSSRFRTLLRRTPQQPKRYQQALKSSPPLSKNWSQVQTNWPAWPQAFRSWSDSSRSTTESLLPAPLWCPLMEPALQEKPPETQTQAKQVAEAALAGHAGAAFYPIIWLIINGSLIWRSLDSIRTLLTTSAVFGSSSTNGRKSLPLC